MPALTRACVVAAVASCLVTGTATATTITIDQASDTFGPVGNFYLISGVDHANSSPGQVIEVLGGPGSGLQTNTGTEFETRSTEMGDLWDTLSAGGITSTNLLVFGFGNNQSGTTGTHATDITALTMTFTLPGGGTKVFDLGSNNVLVYNYVQGQSHAEARFGVNLGFDFMSTYNTDSTQAFTIYSSISNADDGFEIYFLSSGYTGGGNGVTPAVPEPASLLLLGTGLALIARTVRRGGTTS